MGCGTGYAATVKGLQVIAPYNKVDFGLANFLGIDSTTVHGSALVNVFTAGKRVMPMYAVQGCDYGLQTLADPANGHTTPVVPTLAFNTDNNSTNLLAGSPRSSGTPRAPSIQSIAAQLDRQHPHLHGVEVRQDPLHRLLPR